MPTLRFFYFIFRIAFATIIYYFCDTCKNHRQASERRSAMKTVLLWAMFLCTLLLCDPVSAADGDWTGGGASPFDYWDASNWRDGQIAHGAGSTAYFTNNLPDKLLLTNDVTLGYMQWIDSVHSAVPVGVEGASITLEGAPLTIRTDNRRVDLRSALKGSDGFTKTGNQALYSYRRSEMSGPVTVNAGVLGLDFRQDADSTNALALNHLQPDGLVFSGPGHVRFGGRPSRATDQTGVFTLDTSSRRVTRVSGVSVGDLSAGQVVTAAPGVLPEGTFLKTIWDNNVFELSADPLVGGDVALTFKAATFTTEQHFHSLQHDYSGYLYIGGTDMTVKVGELKGGYRLTGDGDAALAIQTNRNFGGVITLTDSLTLILNDQRPIPSAPADGAAFHVDASDASTLVTSQSGGNTMVTKWLDKNGTRTTNGTDVRFAVSQSNRPGLLSPFLVQNALNGLPVVDFGPAGSCRGMLWNETPLGGIRTFFMIIGSQEGGGILLGSKEDLTCSFERGMDVYTSKGDHSSRQYRTPLTRDHALFWDLAAPTVNRTWINGQEVDHLYTGLSGGYDLVSFVWKQNETGGSASGFAMRGGMVSPYYPERSGGQRLAEVIVYQRVLTEEERRDTEAYLYHKWFNKVLPGYAAPQINTVQVNGSNTLRTTGDQTIAVDVLTVADSATLNVPAGTSATVQNAGVAGNVRLSGGSLQFSAYQTPLAPAPDATLHLDATTNLTLNGSEVTRWDDASGGNHYAFSYSGFGPTVAENALNGLPVVDFGTIGSKKFLAWDTNIVIRSLFLVMNLKHSKSAPIGTYLPLFGARSHFTRLGTPFVWNPAGQLTVRTGNCYLNGARIHPCMYPITHNSFNLLGQVLEGSSIANAFACEAYLYTDPENRADRTGGMQLAEVIIYTRKLTERESMDTQAYLNWKWFNRLSAGYAEPGGTVTLPSATTSAAGGELRVGGTAPVTLTSVAGAGPLTLGSSVPLTLTNTDTLNGGLNLTNAFIHFPTSRMLASLNVSGQAEISVATGATLSVNTLSGNGTLVCAGDGVTALNAVSGFDGDLTLSGGTLAVTAGSPLGVGTLTVAGSGSLCINNNGARLSSGVYPLILFDNIDAVSTNVLLTNWTISGVPSHLKGVLQIRGNQVVAVLSAPGTLLSIQ